jgi:type I restriction enzyme M protein
MLERAKPSRRCCCSALHLRVVDTISFGVAPQRRHRVPQGSSFPAVAGHGAQPVSIARLGYARRTCHNVSYLGAPVVLAVRDPDAPIVFDKKSSPEPDPELRDNENVPLPPVSVEFSIDVTERLRSVEYRTAVDDYMTLEVLPYVPDAWVDHAKTRIGYEIPLTRQFYTYVPPRPLAEIDAEIDALESEIQERLAGVKR